MRKIFVLALVVALCLVALIVVGVSQKGYYVAEDNYRHYLGSNNNYYKAQYNRNSKAWEFVGAIPIGLGGFRGQTHYIDNSPPGGFVVPYAENPPKGVRVYPKQVDPASPPKPSGPGAKPELTEEQKKELLKVYQGGGVTLPGTTTRASCCSQDCTLKITLFGIPKSLTLSEDQFVNFLQGNVNVDVNHPNYNPSTKEGSEYWEAMMHARGYAAGWKMYDQLREQYFELWEKRDSLEGESLSTYHRLGALVGGTLPEGWKLDAGGYDKTKIVNRLKKSFGTDYKNDPSLLAIAKEEGYKDVDAYVAALAKEGGYIPGPLDVEYAIAFQAQAKMIEEDGNTLFNSFFGQLDLFTGYSGLLKVFNVPDDALRHWREEVSSWFDNAILGGVDHWESAICQAVFDVELPSENVAFTELGRLSIPSAYVNGERTNTTNPLTGNETFIYKLSYFVKIPEGAGASDTYGQTFNIYIEDGEGNKKWLFVDEDTGEPISDLIIRESNNYYEKIVLKFSDSFDFVTRDSGSFWDYRDDNLYHIENDIIDVNTGTRTASAYGVSAVGGRGAGSPGAPVVSTDW